MTDDTKPTDAAKAKFRDALHREILDGLKNEQDRRAENLRSMDYYNLRGTHLVPRKDAESDSSFKDRPKRSLGITRRVINVLCSKLYAPGPNRDLPDDATAARWLADVYEDCLINSLWQQADRMSTLNGIAAFQVGTTGDPARPISYQLWSGWHEVIPYEMPGQANVIAAVVTIDAVDNQTRYTLWTDDDFAMYESEKLKPGQTMGGRTTRLVDRQPNPYGVLPFSFVFHELPVAGVDSVTGLGPFLSELNGTIDVEMSDMAQAVIKYHTPYGVIYDGDVGWQPVKRSGDFIRVTSIPSDLQTPPTPKLDFLQAHLDIVGGWTNINAVIDRELEALGVPLTSYRMENQPHASGVALVAEQKPLQDYAVSRREPFRRYEDDLKKVTLLVAGAYYGRADLAAAADEPISLTWPAQTIDMPGPDQDAADGFSVEAGYESPVMIVQRRFGMSREQAINHLKQVADDHKELGTIMQDVPGINLAGAPALTVDPNNPQPIVPGSPGVAAGSGALPPAKPFAGAQPFGGNTSP